MTRLLLFLFGTWLLFTVFVTVFAASANKNEVRNLPKWLWVIICAIVPIIGGLLYLVLGRPIGRPKRTFGRTRVIAPDDDPQFLRDLASKLDSAEKQDNKPESEATKDSAEEPNDGSSDSDPSQDEPKDKP